MSDQSAADKSAPRSPRSAAPRDEASERSFMDDQLKALLASPTLARVADRHSEGRDDPAEFDASSKEHASGPNIDAQLLRDALRAGLK